MGEGTESGLLCNLLNFEGCRGQKMLGVVDPAIHDFPADAPVESANKSGFHMAA